MKSKLILATLAIVVFVFYADSVGEEAKPQAANIQQNTIAKQKSSVTSGEKIFQAYLNHLAIRELFITEEAENHMKQKVFSNKGTATFETGETFHLNRKYNYGRDGNAVVTDTTTTTNTDKTAPTYIYDTKETRDAIGRIWSLEGTIKSSTGETFHLDRKYNYGSDGNAIVIDTTTTTNTDKAAPTYIYDTKKTLDVLGRTWSFEGTIKSSTGETFHLSRKYNYDRDGNTVITDTTTTTNTDKTALTYIYDTKESRDVLGRTWSLEGTIKSSTGETFHLNRKYNYGNDGNTVITDTTTTTHTDKAALTYRFDFIESFNVLGQSLGFEGKILDSEGQLTKINRKSAVSVDNVR